MNQFPVFLSLFLLLLCYGCGKAGRQTEIMRHQKYLLHALTTNNMASQIRCRLTAYRLRRICAIICVHG